VKFAKGNWIVLLIMIALLFSLPTIHILRLFMIILETLVFEGCILADRKKAF
jgi:hypothetical protein